MTNNEIKALFPLEVDVTQEMIDSADINNPNSCIGALALKSILPDELKNEVIWGNTLGLIGTHNVISVYSAEVGTDGTKAVMMMRIKKPQTVTLTLVKPTFDYDNI